MPAHSINAVTLKKLLEEKKVLLIDVRRADEHAEMSIAGSLLIPMDTISQDKINNPNKLQIVIHCQSGRRSALACNKLLEFNPDLELYNLEGGIEAWEEKGYEVVKAQQVRPSF